MGEKRHFIKSVGRVAMWSVLAAGIAALAILSAKYSLGFGKDEFSHPSWDVTQKFDLFDLLYKFLPSSYDTVRPAGLPFVYCGTLTLILVPAFFLCKKISNREKVASAIFILFFVGSFATSTIDLIWHGFQKPNWLNYRYSFMLSFFLLVLAYKAFDRIAYVSRKALLGTTAFVALFVLIVQRLDDYLTEQNEYIKVRPFATIWLCLGCLLVYFTLICLMPRVKRVNRESVAIVLAFVVCVEMFLNGLSEMNSLDSDVTYSKYSRYNNALKTFLPIAETIQANDDGFYRTEKTYHRKTNDNFALNMKGLSCSTSALNRETIDFLASMGYAGASHWSKYVGGNPVSDSIMGIKYLITDRDMSVFYGQPIYLNEQFEYDEDLATVSNPDVYLNPYALSLAFGVSQDFTAFHPYKVTTDGNKEGVYGNPMEQLNAMITAMLGETETVQVFKPAVQIGEPVTENSKFSSYNTMYDRCIPEDVSKDAKLTYTFSIPTDTELFMYVPCGEYPREVKIKANGTSKGGFAGDSDTTYRCMVSLGTYSSDTLSLELTLNNSSNNLYLLKKDSERPYQSLVYYIDWEVFENAMARLAQTQYIIDPSCTDDHLTGTMTTAQDNQMILTTIAYDEGWHILVDGQEVELSEAADALISFTVDKAGEHTIEMKYMPSVVKLGIVCSILCTVIFILLAVLWRWLKKLPVLGFVFEIPGTPLPVSPSEEDMLSIDPGDMGAPFLHDVPPTDPRAPLDIDETSKSKKAQDSKKSKNTCPKAKPPEAQNRSNPRNPGKSK